MNQGLAAHIIATLVYIGLVMFIVNGEPTTMTVRTISVVFCVVFNLLVMFVCFMLDLYNKKTN